MKAAVLRGTGEAFVVEELRLRALGPSDVHVQVNASGVCHTDLSIQNGTIPHPLPAVLGHEGAGTVLATGADVTTLVPGDHVVLAWVAPCRACFFCLRGHPELCEHGLDHARGTPYATGSDGSTFLAALGTATFGEETIVPERACVKIESSFPLELAALVGCGVVTGVGAVCNSAHVEPGAVVVVIGCGGVGLAAIQGARLAGAAPIIAVDRVASKFELARRCGATETIDSSTSDPVAAVKALTGGRGADHVFEVVGRSDTIEAAFEMTRRAGTCTIVGAGSPADMVKFGALQLMVGAKTLRGCVYGSTDPARDFPEIVRLQQAGKLDLEALVTRHIALEELNDAFRAMQAGEVARSIIVY